MRGRGGETLVAAGHVSRKICVVNQNLSQGGVTRECCVSKGKLVNYLSKMLLTF
jgi:hypothetical protein